MAVLRFLLSATLLAGSGLPAVAQGAPAVPAFVEETATAGIASSYDGGWEHIVGGGAAVFDCNDDGFPDVFLAGGTSPSHLFANRSDPDGALRFEPVESGLELADISGAYPLDVDSDGIMDLVLLRVGENLAMRGTGQCRFERANEAWGFQGGDGWSTALAATWEHGAAWPTIAVGNYIDRREEAFPWGSCTDNWLHRPAPDGAGFAPPIALRPSFCALSMLFTDWNRSGKPSLRVSNDREYYKGGQEQMWRIPPGAPPALYTARDGWKPLRVWGMGIASADLNGDGFPEYFLTSMADSKLQTLADPKAADGGHPTYTDVAFARGVTAHRPYTGGEVQPSTGWHPEFEDVNNDGLTDLFIAKGNVGEMPDFARNDPNNLLLQQPDGTFVEAGDKAGVASMMTARGAALADFNLDGWLDLVVVNREAPAQVWRNTGTGGQAPAHWIGLRPLAGGVNRDAVGGWIEVRCEGPADAPVMRHEITVGGGHAGGQTGWWHFGLGDATEAQVRVIWPDGTAGDWQALAADGFYVIRRDGPAERFTPARG